MVALLALHSRAPIGPRKERLTADTTTKLFMKTHEERKMEKMTSSLIFHSFWTKNCYSQMNEIVKITKQNVKKTKKIVTVV